MVCADYSARSFGQPEGQPDGLTGRTDDGIVVGRSGPPSKERRMAGPVVSIRLREKLGSEASDDLAAALEDAKKDMLIAAHDRFEARLGTAAAELRQEIATGDAALRVAFTEGLARIRTEIADMRVDVLRWSFVFWLGQVIAIATLLAFMLRTFAGR
jgi:hypothetical protein